MSIKTEIAHILHRIKMCETSDADIALKDRLCKKLRQELMVLTGKKPVITEDTANAIVEVSEGSIDD